MSTHALGGSKLRPMMSAMAPLPRAEPWLQMSHPLNFDDRGVSTVFIMIMIYHDDHDDRHDHEKSHLPVAFYIVPSLF